MKLVFDDIRLRPGTNDSAIADELAKAYHIDKPASWRIVLKSLDARHKNRILYRYRVVAEVPDDAAEALLKRRGVSLWREEPAAAPRKRCDAGRRVIVVGAGPAGLFCALRLCRAGAGVVLLERGFEVEKRMAHIGRLKAEGVLNPESNVLFGEGGAGAYSDGKLTTRTHRPEMAWVYATLTECGAPERILYEQKPHLGTDGLTPVVRALRETLLSMGAVVRFNTRVDDLIISGGAVKGVITAAGDAHEADAVVLAAGHSARDTGEMLLRLGVLMEKKPFAMGVRVEHPAALIDEIQYGPIAREKLLPAADYRLVHNNGKTGRAVYSFCVCPGGEVINSSSEDGALCVNGMSYSRRDGGFSNGALVVTVSPSDCPEGPLGGVVFQRAVEERAYGAGGGGFFAPGQRVTSFVRGAADRSLPGVSYRPGVRPVELGAVLPDWIAGEIRAALKSFDRKMRGYISDEGVIIGVETRSSSPLRISRQKDFQSVSHPGLYPAGEGAGYAGGIISSAVDGVRAADAICGSFGNIGQ